MKFPTRVHMALFAIFSFCALVLVDFLPASWSNDAVTVLGIATGEISSEDSGSYYLTSVIFGGLGEFSIVLILIIGYFWSGQLAPYVKNKEIFMVFLFLTYPGVLMGMVRPQKDVFVGLLVVFILLIERQFSNSKNKMILLWGGVYFVYGAAMRPYFILIFFIFILVLFLKSLNKNWVLWFLFVVVFSSFFLSQEDMLMLQGARDVNNILRGVDEEQRTAFGNVYPFIDGVFEFWLNYFNAFFRLNFPLFYYFDIQAIGLQLAVLLYFYVIYKSSCLKLDFSKQCLVVLFGAHFLFLPLFEPDLGSYLRHISLAAAYLVPVLFYVFRDFRNASAQN